MLYMFCPTCRELLGDKQKYYETRLREICDKNEMGLYKTIDEFNRAKEDLINNLGLRRYCCKMKVMTYVRQVILIK